VRYLAAPVPHLIYDAEHFLTGIKRPSVCAGYLRGRRRGPNVSYYAIPTAEVCRTQLRASLARFWNRSMCRSHTLPQ